MWGILLRAAAFWERGGVKPAETLKSGSMKHFFLRLFLVLEIRPGTRPPLMKLHYQGVCYYFNKNWHKNYNWLQREDSVIFRIIGVSFLSAFGSGPQRELTLHSSSFITGGEPQGASVSSVRHCRPPELGKNYTGQGTRPQKKRCRYQPWNRTDRQVHFQSEMSQGAFHPSVFLENMVTNTLPFYPLPSRSSRAGLTTKRQLF